MRDWVGFVRERLDLPPMKGHHEERLVRELADHLEETHREALVLGRSSTEADEIVARELEQLVEDRGALLRTEPAHLRTATGRWVEGSEETLRARGGTATLLADALRDVRTAVRSLLREPAFSLTSIGVLGLGIGATAAIFALVDSIVLSPLPFPEQGELVSLSHRAPTLGMEDVGQCAAWHFTYADQSRTFASLGMYTQGSVAVAGVGDPESVEALYVTADVFSTLGLAPLLGRGLGEDDTEVDAARGLVLSDGYWETRFARDPDVLGRIIQIDGASWEVVGVMPDALSALGFDPAVILPLRYDESRLFVGNIGMDAVARLRDGVTLEQAQADLERVLPIAWERFPGGPVPPPSATAVYQPVVTPLQARLLGSTADLLWILLAGVGLVLLMSCANVASLVLVRAEGRDSEMAVRAAIGASRRRIGWEYAKESLILGLGGGLLGLLLARLGLRGLIAIAPNDLLRLDDVELSATVVLAVLAVSLLTGLIFGSLPVLRGRSSPGRGLSRAGRGATGRGAAVLGLDAFAVGQMALAVVLLVGSGLLVRTMGSLRDVDPGFRSAATLQTLRLSIPSTEIPDVEQAALTFEMVARRLAEVPGVDAVGMGTSVPLDGGGNVNAFIVDGLTAPGYESPPNRRHKWIGESYFETLGIPLLAGRTFTWDDVRDRFPGAILSESLAIEYWGSAEAALGGRVAARTDAVRWHEVVGVVADVKEDGLHEESPLMVYWPQVTLAFWQRTSIDQVQTWRSMAFVVRSDRVGTPGLLADLREAVWDVAPTLPVREVHSLEELMAESVARTTFALTLLGIAAAVALLLGVVGVYGVISYAVSRQSREFGMRLALGARAADVRGLVLRRGLVIAGLGVSIGLMLARLLTGLMAELLFAVEPTDPVTFLVAPAVLAVVALLASYVPARRAGRVDPIVAMRAR